MLTCELIRSIYIKCGAELSFTINMSNKTIHTTFDQGQRSWGSEWSSEAWWWQPSIGTFGKNVIVWYLGTAHIQLISAFHLFILISNFGPVHSQMEMASGYPGLHGYTRSFRHHHIIQWRWTWKRPSLGGDSKASKACANTSNDISECC